MELNELWEKAKEELQQTVPTYKMWIEPLKAVSFDGNLITLISAYALAPQAIKSQHDEKILEALKNACGKKIGYTILFDKEFADNYQKELKKEFQKQRRTGVSEETNVIDNLAQMQSSANLNLKYKFANFVVGENSRFAHAAAFSVAQNPAKKYNPLFIYGASGLGKTHLMQAIGHYVIFNKPKLKVKYIKTEEYVNELIKNIQCGGNDRNQRMEKFRQKYRNVDVLLIDDIQFLESKTYTMEEIFHTFDSLHNNNKQIVITSDRLPKDIPTLPDRLRTRFEMGLVVDITPPDFETRVAILKNLAEQANIQADFSVFEYIAKNYINNVRELEGAFNKVSAYADIEQTELTLEFAKKVLNCEAIKQEISIAQIAQIVGEYYRVSVADFLSSARNQRVSSARHVAVYLSREITQKSFENIAEFFNKKHTTMLYSYEKIRDELKVNRELESSVLEIRRMLEK